MKQIRELFFNFANNAINTYKGSNSGGAEAQRKAASAKVTHSVAVADNGIQYVQVDVDQERFEGLSEEESQKEARKVIKEKFSGKVIGKDNKAFVNGTTADEYTHPIKKIDDAEV